VASVARGEVEGGRLSARQMEVNEGGSSGVTVEEVGGGTGPKRATVQSDREVREEGG
jgi:hypothetical protein